MRSERGAFRHGTRRLTVLFALSCLTPLCALSATAVASTPDHSVSPGPAQAVTPPVLLNTAARSNAAENGLVHAAVELRNCRLAHPARCTRAWQAFRRAGNALAGAERALAQVVGATGQHASVANTALVGAPRLTVAGYKLHWTRLARVRAYILRRQVRAQKAQYSLVKGTSAEPAPVPGAGVSYSVKAATYQSAWSPVQVIPYRAPELANWRAAPVVTVTGQTLSWPAIARVTSYIVETKVGGISPQDVVLNANKLSPTGIAGTTVHYRVRTAVYGSTWSAEAAIAFPKEAPKVEEPKTEPPKTEPPKTEPPKTEPPKAEPPKTEPPKTEEPKTETPKTEAPAPELGLPFVKGIVEDPAGWGEGAAPKIGTEIHTLGAEWVRIDLPWKEVMPSPGVYNWSNFDNTVRVTEAMGLHILPILGYAPSWTTPTNAAGYAEFVAAAVARYGPGTTANLQWFELWNEPYFSYAWSNKMPEPEAYARDVVAASEAAKRISPTAKFLIAGEYADGEQTGGTSQWETAWNTDMFLAEPNLGKWVDGVAVHPYGDDPSMPVASPGAFRDASGGWSFQRIDSIHEQFTSHGVNVPFWITEVGWSTREMSEAQQAHDYEDLITQVKLRPWVRAMFPYCLREFQEHPESNESQTGLLLFGTEQPKLAFYTLEQWYHTSIT